MSARRATSRRRNGAAFFAVRTEGGLLSMELLQRVADLAPDLPATARDTYHLAPRETVDEAVNRA